MSKQETRKQKLRTRKDLLNAAGQLLREGRTPTIEEIAEVALVSRATAYRYFSTIDDLLIEAPIEVDIPEANKLFPSGSKLSIEERVDKAEAIMHDFAYKNEFSLRAMLLQNLKASGRSAPGHKVPVRQNRRTAYIEEALAPHRKKFNKNIYEKLCASLALIFGTESLLVFRDVVPISAEQARKVKSWALKSLVKSALEESRKIRSPQ